MKPKIHSNYRINSKLVPQGSILRPLLFIITMNDIGNVSDFLYFILYADDTCVLLSGKKYLKLVKLLNSELYKLSIWLIVNNLSLNVKKSYSMVFHRAKFKLDKHAVIKVNGVSLQSTNSFKYLGVIIDHKLNWTQHIAHVKNKVSKGIGIMYRARNYLTKNSLKSLYFSYIYPYLIYCVDISGISPQTHIKNPHQAFTSFAETDCKNNDIFHILCSHWPNF